MRCVRDLAPSSVLLLLVLLSALEDGFAQVLFQSGKITVWKFANGRRIKHRSDYENVGSIDNHLFANMHVENLKVHTKKMEHLHEGAVKNLDKLKVLRLRSCGIRKLSPGAFKNLPRLFVINLKENRIDTIEEGVFNYLPVESLFLQRNEIRTIKDGAFDHMPNLQTIQLNKNRIASYSPLWFRNTPRLTFLYFRRNAITELPARAFENIKGSHDEMFDTKLFFSHNAIARVHPDAFKNLDGVHQIFLDRNDIKEIDRNTFGHMTHLEELVLTKNQLSSLDKRMFANLQRIEVLELSRNNLECIPYEIAKIATKVSIDRNDADCDCLQNLKDRLVEEGLENKIDDDDEC